MAPPNNKYLHVARLINEDDDFMIIEIMKDKDDIFTVKEGDQFYTLMFVRQNPAGEVAAFIPWEEAEV